MLAGWHTKIFKTKPAMDCWLQKMKCRIQWEMLFVGNGWAVTYRKLRG